MLIKYDARLQVWIASMVIDGQPVMCISRNMSTAMHLLSMAATAEPVTIDHEPIPLVMYGGFVGNLS